MEKSITERAIKSQTQERLRERVVKGGSRSKRSEGGRELADFKRHATLS